MTVREQYVNKAMDTVSGVKVIPINIHLVCMDFEWSRTDLKTCVFVINREVRHASCGYIPRSSWAWLSGPGCPLQGQPECVWQRRCRSPAPGHRRTPQSSASVCRSPAARGAWRASPRWRCPTVSAREHTSGQQKEPSHSYFHQTLVGSGFKGVLQPHRIHLLQSYTIRNDCYVFHIVILSLVVISEKCDCLWWWTGLGWCSHHCVYSTWFCYYNPFHGVLYQIMQASKIWSALKLLLQCITEK